MQGKVPHAAPGELIQPRDVSTGVAGVLSMVCVRTRHPTAARGKATKRSSARLSLTGCDVTHELSVDVKINYVD